MNNTYHVLMTTDDSRVIKMTPAMRLESARLFFHFMLGQLSSMGRIVECVESDSAKRLYDLPTDAIQTAVHSNGYMLGALWIVPSN